MSTMLLALLALALTLLPSSAQEAFTCDSQNDDCPFKLDNTCDSELGTTQQQFCPGGDCGDCDPCNLPHLNDCQGCLSNARGCHYCPADGRCFSQTDFELGLVSLCSPDQYISAGNGDTCSTRRQYEVVDDGSGKAEPMYSDPLYSTNAWVYKLINVVPAWVDDSIGSGVRIRVHANDGSVDPNLLDIAGRFDGDGSCPTDTLLPAGGISNSLAALVAAGFDDDLCAVGIAPGAMISTCTTRIGGTEYSENIGEMDISLNPRPPTTCTLLPPPQNRRSLQTECPFLFQNPGDPRDFPCDVCDFETMPLSGGCQISIIEYCSSYFPIAQTVCIEYLDLFLFVLSRCDWNTALTTVSEGLSKGIAEGREGKGIIYVVGSGDSNVFGTETNNDQRLTNSRLTITVGAVDPLGKVAVYSVGGSSLMVMAPGGADYFVPNMVGSGVTTNGVTRCDRLSSSTQYSSAIAAGVVALILGENIDLTWRDVQGILVQTSRMPEVAVDATPNAVGLVHSYRYGFGIVDAHAAVQAAKTWENYGQETMLLKESEVLNLTIPEISVDTSSEVSASTILNAAVSTTLDFKAEEDAGDDFVVESVVVYVLMRHFSRGHVRLVLTSPHGTESTLLSGNRNEDTQIELSPNSTEALDGSQYLKLMTVRSWGESPVGSWKLSVVDTNEGSYRSCADRQFEYSFQTPKVVGRINCPYLEDSKICVRGIVLSTAFDRALREAVDDTAALFDALSAHKDDTSDLTFDEACCACGGGREGSVADEDKLIQWKLAVYGRGSTPAPPPTPMATNEPTNAPMNSENNGSGSVSGIIRFRGLYVAILLIVALLAEA